MSEKPRHWRTERREERLREVLSHRQPGLTVVLENIHDPHNVSAILRSADAVGVHEVSLLYNIEAFPNLSRWGKRSSAGTRKWIERNKYSTVEECYGALRSRGFTIYASSFSEESKSILDLDLTGNVAFVLGNESRGISDEAAELADARYIVPMVGMTQSLNVSVAAAATLYEAFRQRLTAGLYAKPQLPPEEIERLLDLWLKK